MAVGLNQLYDAKLASLSALPFYITYLLLPAVLFVVLYLFVRLNGAVLADLGFRSSASTVQFLAIGVGLGALYLTVQLEPGILFGFSGLPLPTAQIFALVFLTAPLVVGVQEGIFRGFFLRAVSVTKEFPSATYLSAGLFALSATSFSLFPVLGLTGSIQVVFTTTLETFAVGLVASIFFYKSNWTLWGVVGFRVVQLVQADLFSGVVRASSWTEPFFFVLLACVAVVVVLLLLWPEPRARSRRYLGEPMGPRTGRFRQRARLRHEVTVGVVTLGLLSAGLGGAFLAYASSTDIRTPFLAIPTGSMVPTIEPGDLVVLTPVTGSPIPIGTIIAYRTTCFAVSPVVHRVIAEHETASGSYVYTTKGDHNPSPDPCPVPASAVVGKVSVVVPDLGILILEPLVTVALVVCAGAVSVVLTPRRRLGGGQRR